MMSMDLEHTPFPLLPSFDVATPATPKRKSRTSAALNRRVRANLNTLSVPDLSSVGGSSATLQLQPQGRTVLGSSYEKLLLSGAVRNKNKVMSSHGKPKTNLRTPAPRTIVSAPNKANSLSMKTSGTSLMSLRMAAMLKGSADAKNVNLKFGGQFDKSFAAPGRARSSPYRPSRSMPLRNRSFNAVSA